MKIKQIIIALIICLGIFVPVFASENKANTEDKKQSDITINLTIKGHTFILTIDEFNNLKKLLNFSDISESEGNLWYSSTFIPYVETPVILN